MQVWIIGDSFSQYAATSSIRLERCEEGSFWATVIYLNIFTLKQFSYLRCSFWFCYCCCCSALRNHLLLSHNFYLFPFFSRFFVLIRIRIKVTDRHRYTCICAAKESSRERERKKSKSCWMHFVFVIHTCMHTRLQIYNIQYDFPTFFIIHSS